MNEVRARIISQEKGIYKISNGTEGKTAMVSGKFRYEAQTVSDYPAVGDYVLARWPEDNSNAVITGLFPRKSCFIRKAAGTRKSEQVVAANIDTVYFLVLPASESPHWSINLPEQTELLPTKSEMMTRDVIRPRTGS